MNPSTWSRAVVAAFVMAGLGAGCASTSTGLLNHSVLAQQMIRDADVAGKGHVGKPAELIAEAKSEVAYAQHLPGDPAHAQRLYERAEVDAELAVVLARRESQAANQRAELTARQLVVSAGVTP